jgi:hypothetical protein
MGSAADSSDLALLVSNLNLAAHVRIYLPLQQLEEPEHIFLEGLHT